MRVRFSFQSLNKNHAKHEFLNPNSMKKLLILLTLLIVSGFTLSAQRTKDVLYLKNGSMVYGKLVEIKDGQYKIQTAEGSIFIFKTDEVERFAKESPNYDGRKKSGFGFALEAGLLVGSQETEYQSPFSFNVLAGTTIKTRNVISFGSGVEFIGKPFMPLFLEYKYIFNEKKAAPFIFARGGGIIQVSATDPDTYDSGTSYGTPFNYKGGGSFTIGSGISWARDDYETYLSFAYRYAHTSYQQKEYNTGFVTYSNSLNRLEIKFGFRF
jgi:hypothetical protein